MYVGSPMKKSNEKISVSRDAGRSAAQDSAIIMDSRMSEFKGKLTFVRRAVQ